MTITVDVNPKTRVNPSPPTRRLVTRRRRSLVRIPQTQSHIRKYILPHADYMPEKYRLNLGNPQQKRIIIATGKLSNGELQHVGNYWAHCILWYLGLDKIIHRRRVKDGCSGWHRQMSKEYEYQNMRKKEKKEEEEKEEEGQKKKIFIAFRSWPMLLPSPGLVNPVWLKSLVGQVYYLYLVNALL